MRHSLLLVALAACNTADGGTPAKPIPVMVPKLDPVAKGAPHGQHITEVAITEEGDAALTMDMLGSVRLWPALDASRKPVPVIAPAAKQLALSHAGRDLLAIVHDDAGVVSLLTLGRDGSVRARAQLPERYEQVVPVDGSVLVRTADHTIEWFAADGTSRGRIVVEPGARVQALAARHGAALAIVTDGTITQARWLELGSKLAWGMQIGKLPKVRGELVGLAPDHRHLAIVDDVSSVFLIYELGLQPRSVARETVTQVVSSVGFVDNDHAAAVGNQLVWMRVPVEPAPKEPTEPAKDPWAVISPPSNVQASIALPGSGTSTGAIGNDVVISGYGASLYLVDRNNTPRYLGYKINGNGALMAVGNSVAVAFSGTHYAFLDDKLQLQRDVEIAETNKSAGWMYVLPLDAHTAVRQSQADGKFKIELVDLDPTPRAPIELGTFSRVDRMEYSPESGILGVATYKQIARFQVDLAKYTAQKLEPLRIKGSFISLRLLDPERANGLVAITFGYDSEYAENYTLSLYSRHGKQVRRKKVADFIGQLFRVDGDGTYYTLEGGKIHVKRGDAELASFAVQPGTSSMIAVAQGGQRFAMFQGNELVMVDGKGTELWRKLVWAGQQALFTPDGKTLLVRTAGGLLAFAVATGERTAMECAWDFEVTTTAPQLALMGAAPVCEDPTSP